MVFLVKKCKKKSIFFPQKKFLIHTTNKKN